MCIWCVVRLGRLLLHVYLVCCKIGCMYMHVCGECCGGVDSLFLGVLIKCL